MSKTRLTLVTILLVVGPLATIGFIVSRVFLENFDQIEIDETREQIAITLSLIAAIEDDQAHAAQIWAHCDDMYEFVAGDRPEFVYENLRPEHQFLPNFGLNGMVFVNRADQIVAAVGHDSGDDSHPPPPAELMAAAGGSLLARDDPTRVIRGLLDSSQGPLMVISTPILRHNRSGPAAGTLLWSSRFDHTVLGRLQEATDIRAEVFSLSSNDLPSDVRAASREIGASDEVWVQALSEEEVAGYAKIRGLDREQSFLLRLLLPRPAHPQGHAASELVFAILGIVGLLAIVSTRWLLGRLIHSQEARRRTTRLYHSFVEKASEGIVLVDGAHRVIEMNLAAEALLVAETRKPEGRELVTLLAESNAERLPAILSGLDTHPVDGIEIEWELPSGGSTSLEVFATNISEASEDGALMFFRDVGARVEAERRIRHYAYHDYLTGLPNRLLFEDRLELALARARRGGYGLAVIFVDLDDFKMINDLHGHGLGDELLKAVAKRLSDSSREEDTVCRAGGDEFLLLLPSISKPEAPTSVCDGIVARLRQPFDIEGRKMCVTGSVGVTLFPTDGVDRESLMQNADMAMYAAKAEGRNCWRLYDPSMSQGLRGVR